MIWPSGGMPIMPRADRPPTPTAHGCSVCGWDLPVHVEDPPHDRHHLLAVIIAQEVRNQPPTRSQLEQWIKVDEALIRWLEARRRDDRNRILDLEAEVEFHYRQTAMKGHQ